MLYVSRWWESYVIYFYLIHFIYYTNFPHAPHIPQNIPILVLKIFFLTLDSNYLPDDDNDCDGLRWGELSRDQPKGWIVCWMMT